MILLKYNYEYLKEMLEIVIYFNLNKNVHNLAFRLKHTYTSQFNIDSLNFLSSKLR